MSCHINISLPVEIKRLLLANKPDNISFFIGVFYFSMPKIEKSFQITNTLVKR